MRLFVAVEIDDHVRSAAVGVARELKRTLDAGVRVRWVRAENMHLTVRFIGSVPDERVGGTLTALRSPFSIDAFELALAECGVFPRQGPPRALWIGLRSGGASLQALHDELNQRLLAVGIEREARPYSAHLTIGRVNNATRGSGAPVRDAVRTVRVPPARCRISEAVVFESRLSPAGPTYVPQLKIALRV